MKNNDVFPDIPGYLIEKKLGSGGMARVYLGTQQALARKVAIKVLNPQMMENQQLVHRFLNEARTASQLEHLNIVNIHDVGQVDNTCYIVMEYLPDSLIERIRQRPGKKLDPFEAFRVIQQIAKALAYAHRHGIIHRDIKPDNILFRKDNTPVLVDFGIARAIDSTTRLTTIGMIIGTPHYMSPEQCRGEEIDGQSDIYSLGIVLYEMLTGEIPFRADSAAGLLIKHIQEPLPKLPPELSKYQSLLDHMTAKIRTNRVKDGDELASLINRFLPKNGLETIEIQHDDGWVFTGQSTPPPHHQSTQTSEEEATILTPYAMKKPQTKKHSLSLFITVALLLFTVAIAYFLGFFSSKDPNNNKNNTSKDISVVNVEEPDIKQATTAETDTGTQPSTPKANQELPGNESTPTTTNNSTPTTNELANNTTPPPPTDPATLAAKEKEYQRYYILAEEYYKNNDFEKAQENLDLARSAKKTPEVDSLQERIDDYRVEQKNTQFNSYLELAKVQFEAENYQDAKQNISLAHKIKRTSESEKLERQIIQQETSSLRKAQQEKLRKNQDDQAFTRAQAANTVFAYEKYLQQFPSGLHTEAAEKRLNELKNAITLENKIEDDIAFENASKSNSIPAFEEYLRKYPLGSYAKEANAHIKTLKDKMVQNTPIKIDIQQVRCFEAGSKAPGIDLRNYANRFSKTETHYIYIEIDYLNKFYGITDYKNRIKIVFSGPFSETLTGTIEQTKDSQSGNYSRGIGWTEPGKWPTGTFTVSIFIEDQFQSKTQFEIY